MNKIILGLIVVILILAAVLIFSSRSKQDKPSPSVGDIPVASLVPLASPLEIKVNNQPLEITSVYPPNKATNVPLNAVISIAFNQAVTSQQVELLFGPNIDYQTSYQDKVITITPKTSLLPGVIYSFLVNPKSASDNPSPTFTFTTSGEKQPQPDTQPPDLVESTEKFNLENNPDIFLVNKLPYSQAEFEIVKGGFRSTPTEHYYFTVTLKGDQTASQQVFLNWLSSLGLREDQISALDIEYK